MRRYRLRRCRLRPCRSCLPWRCLVSPLNWRTMPVRAWNVLALVSH